MSALLLVLFSVLLIAGIWRSSRITWSVHDGRQVRYNLNFSEDYNCAIEAKVTAQQNALKAENDLNRIKIEAERKVTQAQAEAKALEVQKQQFALELVQLRTIEMMQHD